MPDHLSDSAPAPQGNLSLILHAHLPFVRHAEHEYFLEEEWLFEAVVECYLPLIDMLRRLEAGGFRNLLALSLSPTLTAMLADRHLQRRTARYLQNLLRLAERELGKAQGEEAEVLLFYKEHLAREATLYFDILQQDVIGEWGRLAKAGIVELFTTAATHAFLPLASRFPETVRAQVRVACQSHRHFFGSDPLGFWLPECAYYGGVEKVLAEENLRWFVVESHGLLHGTPRPRFAVYRHVFTPAGPAVFARDPESSRQVWSAERGYPGDPRYRDFYHDLGFQRSPEELRDHPGHGPLPRFTGLKLHQVTGGGGAKRFYQRQQALEAVAEHARHFVEQRERQFQELLSILPLGPIIVAPFDAELFGHWWFEGPEFLETVIRLASTGQRPFNLVTPSAFLHDNPSAQLLLPASSSWGDRGHWEVWLQEANAWIYPHLHMASKRLIDCATRLQSSASPLQERLLAQMGRELMLAQASDWAFLMRGDSARSYAQSRTQSHIAAFTRLYEMIQSETIDEVYLLQREEACPLFPWLKSNEFVKTAAK